MHECKFCNRTFVGKRALTSHQLSHNNTKIIPNSEELWIIVQQLIKNNKRTKRNIKYLLKKNKLYETQIVDFKKIIEQNKGKIIQLYKKRPKIDILDWLNTNYNEDHKTFNEWKKSWSVTDDQMEYLLKYKYVEGVFNILKENLEPGEENYPIRSFKKQKNLMYIYDERGWRLMIDKDFSSLMANIQIKITRAFLRWQELNKDIVNNVKDGKYERCMAEAFGGRKSKESNDRLINKKLFNFVRIRENDL